MEASSHIWYACRRTDTNSNRDITSSEQRKERQIFPHSPLKMGCPSSMISGTTTLYTSSEKPGLHGGVPLPSAAICDGMGGRWGGYNESYINLQKMHPVTSPNLSVTFRSPHSCTKASVVFIAGTAIRIMRPKGLSISQKAWLGKNKLHLSPRRGPGTGKGYDQLSWSAAMINTPLWTNTPLWSAGTRE